jgi:hypothetical protein
MPTVGAVLKALQRLSIIHGVIAAPEKDTKTLPVRPEFERAAVWFLCKTVLWFGWRRDETNMTLGLTLKIRRSALNLLILL